MRAFLLIVLATVLAGTHAASAALYSHYDNGKVAFGYSTTTNNGSVHLNAYFQTLTGVVDYASTSYRHDVNSNIVYIDLYLSGIDNMPPEDTERVSHSMQIGSKGPDTFYSSATLTAWQGGGKGIDASDDAWTAFASGYMMFPAQGIESMSARGYYSTYYAEYEQETHTSFSATWTVQMDSVESAQLFAATMPAAAVPEPTSLAALCLIGICAIRRWRV